MDFLLLPPSNEVCEGYVFTLVCQSFCSQGQRVSVSVHAGKHTPTPPQEQTSWEQTPSGRHPLRSRHPPGAGTPWEQKSPWEQIPLGEDIPPGRHPLGVDTPRSRPIPCAVHAGRYRRAVRILLECILVLVLTCSSVCL